MSEYTLFLDPQFGDVPDPGTPRQITKKTDHVVEGQSRLIGQYVDKPRMLNLLAIYLKQFQDIEDAYWSILEAYNLDSSTCTDYVLSVFGKIVNFPNPGLSQQDYKTCIRARIKILRSNGKPEELIQILRLMLKDGPQQPAQVFFQDLDRSFVIILQTDIGTISPDIILRLLKQAKPTVLMTFVYMTVVDPLVTPRGMRFGGNTGPHYSGNYSGFGSSVTPGGGALWASARGGL